MKRSRPPRSANQEAPKSSLPPGAPPTVGTATQRRSWLASLPVAVLLLCLFLATQYPHALNLPFVNDDYFLLDQTRTASFASLWKRHDLIFGWYRPWSRELHYWALQHVFGTHELPYHLASFVLWLSIMTLFFTWVRRVAGQASAAVATAGLASLALWGTPLLWVAGAQDLWALFFSLIFLHLLVRGRLVWAAPVLILALLSKESAIILPGLATAYLVLVGERGARDAVRRTLHLWLLAAAWVAVHPLLSARLLGSLRTSPETAQRLSPAATVVRTLLAQVNLDSWPRPTGHAAQVMLQGAIGAIILAAFIWLGAAHAGDNRTPRARQRVLLLGLIWALEGWSILFMPSIGWHAYYGVMGSLGAWLLVGTWMSRWPRRAIVFVALLALLRSAQALTLSWDWGNEWYQHRAGNILKAVRQELFRQHPSFPPSSRVFFVHIPNNIGLLAGDGPALRVWYRDTTLRARYYSEYTPRTDGHAERDFFFRFDSTAGLIEVRKGPEEVGPARRSNPLWEDDHEVLAALLLRAWDLPAAATEYGKLAAVTWRTDCLVYAGACHQLMGDSTGAESLYSLVARRMRYPVKAVRDSAGMLLDLLSQDRRRRLGT